MTLGMHLLLTFVGATVPSGLRPSAPCTSCRSFCDMQCSFDGPDPSTRGMKQNVSMFRLTPLVVTGLAEKDSGDPAGDVYFALVRFCGTRGSTQLVHRSAEASLCLTLLRRRKSTLCTAALIRTTTNAPG